MIGVSLLISLDIALQDKLNDVLVQMISPLVFAWRQDFLAAAACLRSTTPPVSLDKVTKQLGDLHRKLEGILKEYIKNDGASVQVFVAHAKHFVIFAKACNSLVLNALAMRAKFSTSSPDIAKDLQLWEHLHEDEDFQTGLGQIICKEVVEDESMKALFTTVQTYVQKHGEAAWATTEDAVLALAVNQLPEFRSIMKTLQLSRDDLLFPIRPTCVPAASAMRTIRPALDLIIQHVGGC
jgi:hypothetical protein